MLFDYRDTVPLSGMPPVSVEEMGDFVRRYIAEGWRRWRCLVCRSRLKKMPRRVCAAYWRKTARTHLAALRTEPLRFTLP